MKHLLMLVLLVIAGQLSAKKPTFDSIKPYESATIQYQKKMQGLYDNQNKKYIVPLSNVEIYELADGFYGIANPKTRLVQIIFHNEHYTFKTSWQSKQMVLDNSTNFEYAGIFQTNNFTTLQMEDVIIVEDGLGYSVNNEKLGTITKRGFAGIYYVSNDLVILTNNKKWNAIHNCNKKHISDVTIFRKIKKNSQIFTQQHNEFYVDSSSIFIAHYQLDSNSITENYSNEYEESLTRTYMKYNFNFKDLKKVLFSNDKEQNIEQIDSLASYFKNSEYENITRFFELNKWSNILTTFDKTKSNTILLYELSNTISIYDLDSKIIVIETPNGNKTFIEIDSTLKSQTKNIVNLMDFTVNYINKNLLFLRWYSYETGQQTGLWNVDTKKWVIEPSTNVLHEFDNHIITQINNINDDPIVKGYDIYNFNGKLIHQFDANLTIEKLLKTLTKVDSVSIHKNTVITYKNGKQGIVTTSFASIFPTRVLFEEYDEIVNASHSDLFMMIKDGQITFAKNYNYSVEYDLIKYDLNAQKLGFSIYPQEYIDFNLSSKEIIHEISSDSINKIKPNFKDGKNNFGYEKLENGNFIIHNVKMKEVTETPILSVAGDPLDLDGDGMEDYQEIILPNISRSGVYSPQQKKWIIAPTKNWIGEFNGNYLTSEYATGDTVIYKLYNQNGNYQTQLFNTINDLTDQIKKLYSADSVFNLLNSIYSVFTKDSHFILDFHVFRGALDHNQLFKNDYLMYNLNNNFNTENLFLCKNEKGYFYNSKNHQEQMDSIIPINNDHYILTSNRDGSYKFMSDTLRYFSKEKLANEFLHYLYSEKGSASKLGKVKLNDSITLIINFSESYIDQILYYNNEYNTENYTYIPVNGIFASGIYNDKTNKWEILPQYEKIIPTETGYTAIKRTDEFFIEDSYIDGYSETRISKTNTFDLYDQNFNLVRQFNEDSNPFENPMNFQYFLSNVEYDTIYEIKNEHVKENSIESKRFENTKSYIYYKNGKGFGAVSYENRLNSLTKTQNNFEVINFNLLKKVAIGIKKDSLYFNSLVMSISDVSSIEIFEKYENDIEYKVVVSTKDGFFIYWYSNENMTWKKSELVKDTNDLTIEGYSYKVPFCKVTISTSEILFNNNHQYIEVYNVFDDFIEPISFNIKSSNDALWRKINGQWVLVLNEGTIEKTNDNYLLFKPEFSSSYFNEAKNETSVLINTDLKPKSFDTYYNPISYQTLDKGYYYIKFKGENENSTKVVCFTPSGKVISDAFNWYEIENGKIKGTRILMDEYGEVMEERSDYFEMTE
jgi:hypothetical protein